VVRLQSLPGNNQLLPQPVEPAQSIGPGNSRLRDARGFGLTTQFALMLGCQLLDRPIIVEHRAPPEHLLGLTPLE
jgi:hypothetical protein